MPFLRHIAEYNRNRHQNKSEHSSAICTASAVPSYSILFTQVRPSVWEHRMHTQVVQKQVLKTKTLFHHEIMGSYTKQHLCIWMAVPGTDTCWAAWYHCAFAEMQHGSTHLMLWAPTATWILLGWAASVTWPPTFSVFQLGMAYSKAVFRSNRNKQERHNFFCPHDLHILKCTR